MKCALDGCKNKATTGMGWGANPQSGRNRRKGQFRGGETVTRELTITIDYPECPHDEDELVELFKTMASYIEGFHVTFQDRSIEKKEE